MSPHVHTPHNPQPQPLTPFIIEIRQERKQPNGSFIPAASLKLIEHLRTSGLLLSLERLTKV